MNVTPKRKSEVPAITANEARRITNNSKFASSGFADLINSTIRETAENGETEAHMLIPAEIAEQAADFLTASGFRVVSEMSLTGVVITAAW